MGRSKGQTRCHAAPPLRGRARVKSTSMCPGRLGVRPRPVRPHLLIGTMNTCKARSRNAARAAGSCPQPAAEAGLRPWGAPQPQSPAETPAPPAECPAPPPSVFPLEFQQGTGDLGKEGLMSRTRPPGAHSWLQRPAKNLATPRGASWAGCGSAQATGDDGASDSFLLGPPLPQPAQRPSHTLQPLPLTRTPLAWLNWLGFSLPQRLLLWATAPRVPRLPGTSIIATRPALVAVLHMFVRGVA